MSTKGLLIAFAGINGTGKRRQAALLCKWLEDQKFTALEMPDIPVYSDMIFKTISNDMGFDDSSEVFPKEVIHFSAAIDKVRVYTPYAEKVVQHGGIILMPEYSYCRMAYAMLEKVNQLDLLYEIYSWLPDADIVFYMDCPTEIAINRLKRKDVVKKELNYFNTFKECYESLTQFKRFVRIDASKSEVEVQNSIREYVKKHLNR